MYPEKPKCFIIWNGIIIWHINIGEQFSAELGLLDPKWNEYYHADKVDPNTVAPKSVVRAVQFS